MLGLFILSDSLEWELRRKWLKYWRSYFLSVGVMLPLTAVLSAAWMEVDPVSWGSGVGGRERVGGGNYNNNVMHSSGRNARPYNNKNPSKWRFALPLRKPSVSLWWLDSRLLAVWRRQSIQGKNSADLLSWANRPYPCSKETSSSPIYHHLQSRTILPSRGENKT